MLGLPLNANIRVGLLTLAGLALAACGSDHSSTPAPTPTPVTTRAFVHVLDHTYDRDARVYAYQLTTFAVDAGTGLLAPVGTLAAATAVPGGFLAADPLRRFVYFSRGSAVGYYRVDSGTGALTSPGETLLRSASLMLAPTRTQLLVGGSERYNDHLEYQTLQALAVDQSGLLTATTLSREFDGYSLVTADGEGDVFYVSREVGSLVVAARLDSSRPEGYRRLATLDLSLGEGGPDIDSIHSGASLAADGLLLAVHDSQLFSFALNDSPAALVPRGHIAASLGGPLAYVHGRVAAASATRGGSYAYLDHNTGINLYSVGAGGELKQQAALAEGSFADIYALAFHPSGRFLYVVGILPNSVSQLSLVTFSVTPEGGFSPFASVNLFPVDNKKTFDKIVVTPTQP